MTTVGYLATRIAGAPKVSPANAVVTPLTFEQVSTLQTILEAKGYDIGKVDGKIGAGTRAAVKDQQIKLGLPANSYPDLALLQKLGG
jgi:peptidoglycan hydrolase-like protein with peptidoglycan-binding domain